MTERISSELEKVKVDPDLEVGKIRGHKIGGPNRSTSAETVFYVAEGAVEDAPDNVHHLVAYDPDNFTPVGAARIEEDGDTAHIAALAGESLLSSGAAAGLVHFAIEESKASVVELDASEINIPEVQLRGIGAHALRGDHIRTVTLITAEEEVLLAGEAPVHDQELIAA